MRSCCNLANNVALKLFCIHAVAMVILLSCFLGMLATCLAFLLLMVLSSSRGYSHLPGISPPVFRTLNTMFYTCVTDHAEVFYHATLC